MKMSKLKWKWIKFWGHRYIWMYPNKTREQVVFYHRHFFDVKLWDDFFKADSKKIKV